MDSYSGDYGDRAPAFDATTDLLVLQYHSRTEEMPAVAYAAVALAGKPGERMLRASRVVAHPDRFTSQRRARLIRADAAAFGRPPS